MLNSVDYFGKQFNFNIGGTFRTSIGGILTIFVFFGTMTLSWYFGSDLYTNSDYKDACPLIQHNNTTDNTFLNLKMIHDNIRMFNYHVKLKFYKYNETTKKHQKEYFYPKVDKCTEKDIDAHTLD